MITMVFRKLPEPWSSLVYDSFYVSCAWYCLGPPSKEHTKVGVPASVLPGKDGHVQVSCVSLPWTCACFSPEASQVQTPLLELEREWPRDGEHEGSVCRWHCPGVRKGETRTPPPQGLDTHLTWGDFLVLGNWTASWVLSPKARALTKAVVVPSCLGASKTTSLVQEIICNTQNLLSPVFNDSWTLARKSKKECIVHEL